MMCRVHAIERAPDTFGLFSLYNQVRAFNVKSVRQQLIERLPPPHGVNGADDQLGHAIHSMLWSMVDPDVSMDGWTLFKVIAETNQSVEAMGLMTLLPSGSIPMSVCIDATDGELVWRVSASLKDESWHVLSKSKQWNAVYLVVTGDRSNPPWFWDRHYEGVLVDKDVHTNSRGRRR